MEDGAARYEEKRREEKREEQHVACGVRCAVCAVCAVWYCVC